jgi:hypothetical protein
MRVEWEANFYMMALHAALTLAVLFIQQLCLHGIGSLCHCYEYNSSHIKHMVKSHDEHDQRSEARYHVTNNTQIEDFPHSAG